MKEKEEVWKDINSNCLAGIRTEARAASQTRFYGSGIWVNVPKRRYNTFFRAVRSSVLIRVKELNPFNSGLDHMRSPRAKETKGEVVIVKLIKSENDLS